MAHFTEAVPSLRTPSRIADRLGVPLHRILYIIATRPHIRPAALSGATRVFNEEAEALIRHEVNAIAARRESQTPVKDTTGAHLPPRPE